MKLEIKKLHPDAILPTFGHPGDAGMDFYALEDVVFPAGKQARVHTGIAMAIPEGYVGLVWDKSSISFNAGLKVMGGVIDSGYRGEIIMNLLNVTNADYTLPKGHKVAQMLIQKFEQPELVEVETLNETVRGEGREGSTGHK